MYMLSATSRSRVSNEKQGAKSRRGHSSCLFKMITMQANKIDMTQAAWVRLLVTANNASTLTSCIFEVV